MKLKNILLMMSLALVSTSAMATVSKAPVVAAPPEQTEQQVGDTEYVTAYDADRIKQAVADGYTVVRCYDGKCWDFITKDPYGYEGGEVDNGFYFFMLELDDQGIVSH